MRKATVTRSLFILLIGACLSSLLLSTPVQGQPAYSGIVSITTSMASTFADEVAVVPPREKPGQHGIEYPMEANQEAVEGTVMLRVLVSADGSVAQLESINQGVDHRLLKAAVDGAYKTLFTPGTVDDVPTEMWLDMEIAFERAKIDVADLGELPEGSERTANDNETLVSSVSVKMVMAGTVQGDVVLIPPHEKSSDRAIQYPTDAFNEGVEGVVKLKILIDTDGSIKESQIVQNGGDERLLRAAIEGLQNTEFAPGTSDGTPQEMWVQVEVTFALEEK